MDGNIIPLNLSTEYLTTTLFIIPNLFYPKITNTFSKRTSDNEIKNIFNVLNLITTLQNTKQY